jgi:hypothetical protein
MSRLPLIGYAFGSVVGLSAIAYYHLSSHIFNGELFVFDILLCAVFIYSVGLLFEGIDMYIKLRQIKKNR